MGRDKRQYMKRPRPQREHAAQASVNFIRLLACVLVDNGAVVQKLHITWSRDN